MGMAEVTRETSGSSRNLSRNEVFNLLSNHRRRYALHVLKQADGQSEIADLAEQVAAWENGKERSEITSSERHRVYTSMQQTHLPAMDRAGVINHDNGTVTLTDQARSLEVYMDVVPGESIAWGQYYLGLSVLSAALLGAVSVGVFPFGALVWAGAATALFLCSAVYHTWQSRQMRLGSNGVPPDVEQ